MSVIMVRQKVKDRSVEAAEAAVRDLFATLDRVRPILVPQPVLSAH